MTDFFSTFPPNTHELLVLGHTRMLEYQGADYAVLYTDRLKRVLPASIDERATDERDGTQSIQGAEFPNGISDIDLRRGQERLFQRPARDGEPLLGQNLGDGNTPLGVTGRDDGAESGPVCRQQPVCSGDDCFLALVRAGSQQARTCCEC